MTGIIFALVASGGLPFLPSEPVAVQFGSGMLGRNVTICLDGVDVHPGFAGKLMFRDSRGVWSSVCGAVRKPIRDGQMFKVRSVGTQLVGGNVSLAGNIAAKWFRAARTADQCAALQLAIWEAIEDGGEHANFSAGAFQARSSGQVISFAEKVYEAVNEPGSALFLQAGNGGGQDQITTVN